MLTIKLQYIFDSGLWLKPYMQNTLTKKLGWVKRIKTTLESQTKFPSLQPNSPSGECLHAWLWFKNAAGLSQVKTEGRENGEGESGNPGSEAKIRRMGLVRDTWVIKRKKKNFPCLFHIQPGHQSLHVLEIPITERQHNLVGPFFFHVTWQGQGVTAALLLPMVSLRKESSF